MNGELSHGHFTRSRKYAVVALVFWFASLALPAFKAYSAQNSQWGYDVLAVGWLGPLVLNFGWFANLFFLF